MDIIVWCCIVLRQEDCFEVGKFLLKHVNPVAQLEHNLIKSADKIEYNACFIYQYNTIQFKSPYLCVVDRVCIELD